MKNLTDIQKDILQYLRQGVWPGELPKHMKVYKEMVEHNFQQSLATTYPKTKLHLSPSAWTTLVQDFTGHHNCQSQIYWQMPGELLVFLDSERGQKHLSLNPWIHNMIRFEWEKVRLYNHPNNTEATITGFSSDLNSTVVMAKDCSVLQLEYAVFHPQWNPQPETGAHFLLLHRDPADHEVHVMQLNPFLFVFTNALLQGHGSIRDILNSVLQATGMLPSEQIELACTKYCHDLADKGVIIGSL